MRYFSYTYQPQRECETALCELFVHRNEACLRRVCEFPGLSFTRFIKKPYIGFAVRNGDDTHPYIMNWKSGLLRALSPPESAYVVPGGALGWVGHVGRFRDLSP